MRNVSKPSTSKTYLWNFAEYAKYVASPRPALSDVETTPQIANQLSP